MVAILLSYSWISARWHNDKEYMQNPLGVFIALEGTDGSGKRTQSKLLASRLKAVGHEVAVFDFPRYSNVSSHFVRRYLNGDYGPASEVSPYTASFFFALDRYEAAPKIKEALGAGKIVLANRFAGSNMAHQGTKFGSLAEQRGFFMWAESLEFELLKIPRPDLNLFLKVPADVSRQLIAKRAKAAGAKLDEHEKSQSHLSLATAAYDLLCQLFPKDFKEINCTRGGQILGIVEINDFIWEAIKPLLPEPRRQGRAIVLNLDTATETRGPNNELGPQRPRPKSASLESILKFRNQMLTKAARTKGLNQRQLKAAINLVEPLHYQKAEFRKLLAKIGAPKSPLVDPVSVNEIIYQLAGPTPPFGSDEVIKLLSANPRNEFLLLDEAKSSGLNYRQKEQALVSLLQKPNLAVDYRFEVTTDYSTLMAFSDEVDIKQIKVSAANPRLGFVLPGIIDDANLDEQFNKAFELSGELYSQMSLAGAKEAVYVLLLGHNVRWRFEVSAAALLSTLKTSKKQKLLDFLGQLKGKIAESHPHVAKNLSRK